MDAVESLRVSWRNVRDHKLRSTLTTLGVIIGIAAVITFVTLGASLQAEIVQTIAGENTEVMYVSASSQEQSGLSAFGRSGEAVFTEHDIARLERIEGVESVTPESGIAASRVTYRDDMVGRQWVTVTTSSYFDVKGYTFTAGRPFGQGHEVVVNQQAAGMFEEEISVGDRITITRAASREDIDATVVGIVKEPSRSQQSIIPQNGQPMIYAPPDPFYERTVVSPSEQEEQLVYVRLLVDAEDVQGVEAVQGRVYTYLGEESDARVLKSETATFKVTTYEQLVNQIEQVSNTFTAYITGIAVISLLVGAIGIANIMLVSVTERTREIGIMKAVGAQNRDILQLFLIEATLLGVVGSVLGSIAGVGGGYLATVLIALPFRFRVEWVLVAVLVGVLVGATAGLYPAWNAARTDPIDALRFE